MDYRFIGPTGRYFSVSDEQKAEIKKQIKKLFINNYNGERCDFYIKADDGFGIIATDACVEFIDKCKPNDYRIRFVCTYIEDFQELSENIRNFYINTIAELKTRNPRCVVDITSGFGTHLGGSERTKQVYGNYCLAFYEPRADFFITYYDRETCKDKAFLRDIDWNFNYLDKYFNLYPIVNKNYDAPKMKGVRKRASSSNYYYRIKCKLPDGTSINIERGSFLTEELAAKARKEHLIELTTQDCVNSDRTVDDVFQEFIATTCNNTPSLKKKYLSFYNTRMREFMGDIPIGETVKELNGLFDGLYNYKRKDMRSNDKIEYLSLSYIQEFRAMMFNFFDYAYKQRLIKNHPMYQINETKILVNREKKRKNKEHSTEPLFAYTGNKYRLLSDLKALFPKNITCFVDLFCGTGVVGINADAEKIIINDNNEFLYGILSGIKSITSQIAWELIESIIQKYDLNKNNEDGYYRCRKEYNAIPYKQRCAEFWYWGLVLVWCSFNRSTVQFNQQDEYNAPFGYNKVNFDLAKRKYFAFAKKVSGINIELCNKDYDMVEVPPDAFVYLDPPYLITTASYNKAWDEQKEKELYLYLEKLDALGIKWALSNALKNNGDVHPALSAWVKEKKYHIHYLEADYTHANFRRKNKGGTVEVLVTNY